MEDWTISQKWLYFNLFARGKILDKRASESDNAPFANQNITGLRIPAPGIASSTPRLERTLHRFLQLATRPFSEPIL